MRAILALLFAAILTGCASRQERDANKCAGYGYQPSTNEFAQCMENRDARRHDALKAYMLGGGMPKSNQPAGPVQKTCTSTPIGNSGTYNVTCQ
jgi:hypothetical protein